MTTNLIRFPSFKNIAQFEPFNDFEDMFREYGLSPALQAIEAAQHMKMDVDETNESYLVKAELPGLKKENIKIDIDGSRVSITAEKSITKETKEGVTLVRNERFAGRLYRRFSLNDEIDAENASATYQDGILELALPKKKSHGAKPLRIS